MQMPDSWKPENEALMRTIRDEYGRLLEAACARSRVSPGFMAALIANESGGAAGVRRLEPSVLTKLWAVLMGRVENFGPFNRTTLLAAIGTESAPSTPSIFGPVPGILQKLDDLASSLGLTQIMGYNALARGVQPDKLRDDVTCLSVTVAMLEGFLAQFKLQPGESERLFRCWNTGHPDGNTADAWYCIKGLARIELYEQAAAAVPAA